MRSGDQQYIQDVIVKAIASTGETVFNGSNLTGRARDEFDMLAIGKTTVARKEDVHDREWFLIDGDNQIVGRLATKIATVLMGKHKAGYTPHVDTGDCVIVVNCERVRFSGKAVRHDEIPYLTSKMEKKEYDSYSGFPSGRRVRSGVEVWEQRPEMILREAVRRMLPKNKLGRHMLKKLRLVTGGQHPYQAQQPKPFPAHLLPAAKD